MTGRPGQTITFNDVGKVSKVVSGSVSQDMVYNVDGSILLRKSTVEGASLFVGGAVLSQAPGSSVVAGVRTYSGAEGKPIAEKSAKTGTAGTTLTWVFSNLEGTVDVQTLANATGATTRVFRDPYGAPIGGSNGVWSSGTGYMNKPVTASTGLTTVGARTYDPVLGKFLSVDPVIDTNLPQQNTGYTYSGNNPTTYIDPSGLRLTIGCEPRCGKGAATIVQKLTPRNQADRANTKVYAEQIKLDAKRQAWGDKIFGTTSLLDGTSSQFNWLPSNKIQDHIVTNSGNGPGWGPLISFIPGYRMPQPENDTGVQGCFGVCGGVSFSSRSGWGWSAGLGLKAELTVSTGLSAREPAPGYVVGECSATALVGATAHVGLGIADRQDSPGGVRIAGTAGGGIKYGIGGGCAVTIQGNF